VVNNVGAGFIHGYLEREGVFFAERLLPREFSHKIAYSGEILHLTRNRQLGYHSAPSWSNTDHICASHAGQGAAAAPNLAPMYFRAGHCERRQESANLNPTGEDYL
jgi:hypothetical protein